MSLEKIKQQLAALSREEQDEVAVYLFHLRHKDDPEYRHQVVRRLNDCDPSHWLSIEEFEEALDRKG